MDKQIILNRIEKLCKERNISLNTAFVESGVGKNFKSNLKISNPSLGKLTMLANYFDVTVDYLLGKETESSPADKPTAIIRNNFSEHEINLINAYRAQPEIQPAVNRLLGIEQDGNVYIYTAAHSEEKRLDEIVRMSKKDWEKIKNAPETDDTLL